MAEMRKVLAAVLPEKAARREGSSGEGEPDCG
jgi:hypothetical protein